MWIGGSNDMRNVCSNHPLSPPGGGGRGSYLKKYNTGRLRPEVQPRTLLNTILVEKASLLYTFYGKKVPLLHTYL